MLYYVHDVDQAYPALKCDVGKSGFRIYTWGVDPPQSPVTRLGSAQLPASVVVVPKVLVLGTWLYRDGYYQSAN
jgi:hypothetical protein